MVVRFFHGMFYGESGYMIKTDVVIGGGATGCGIARDPPCGASTTIWRRGDFANGATGARHGLLHSGCHAVTIPRRRGVHQRKRHPAKDRPQVSSRWRALPWLPETHYYRDTFLSNCEEAGYPLRCSASGGPRLQPELNPSIEEAVVVPDCSIDPFGCACSTPSPPAKGGDTDPPQSDRHHPGAQMHGRQGSGLVHLPDQGDPAKIIINATGAWRYHCPDGRERRPMTLSKGSLIIEPPAHHHGDNG